MHLELNTQPDLGFHNATSLANHGRDASVRGAVRLFLRGEGLLALTGSVLAFSAIDGRWMLFALFFLLPDLSMLGYAFGRRLGAVLYNIGHTYLAPACFGALGFALGLHDLYPLSLIWAAHIGFDRFLGYGLKRPEGFGATHLGWLGRP